jgi:hypothetical protein
MDDKIQLEKNRLTSELLDKWSNEINDLEIYRAAVAIFAGLSGATVTDAVEFAKALAKEVKGE